MTLVTLDYLGPGWPGEDRAQAGLGAGETFQALAVFEFPGELGGERHARP